MSKNAVSCTCLALICLLLAVPAIFGIALVCIGARLRNDIADSDLIQPPNPTTLTACTVTAVQIQSGVTSGFISVWECGRKSVVENPFSFKPTPDLATRDMNNVGLNTSWLVACPTQTNVYPIVDDGLKHVCMFQTHMVAQLQKMNFIYAYSGDTLLGIGVICFFLPIVNGVIIMYLVKKEKESNELVNADRIYAAE